MTSPIVPVREPARLRAAAWGVKCCSRMTFRTRSRTARPTPGWLLMTRETVERETRARAATGSMVKVVRNRAYQTCPSLVSFHLTRIVHLARWPNGTSADKTRRQHQEPYN